MRKPVESTPNRLGALAKLPVFLDLAGKRAVVAGGTPGAAWKAELLAAAGANVDVYAVEPAEEMTVLLERGAAAGTITHHARAWALDVFPGAAIALADTVDDAEGRAFFCAAKAAGVPVNVIDRPAFCQFQFGSIVNRSPVVIGISTDGAAPILGQAIRQRIETLLPAALADWAQLAKSVRGAVMARLPKGPARRAFWERFSQRAFGPAPPGDLDDATVDIDILLSEVAAAASHASPGRVTLVGAGPGDAELLTLKAVRALQSADVILFDDLVSDDVLELARREAKRMMVGKRGHRDSCSQADINALMLKLAGQGKHVVRLKSGDPMIFGRAGEEIAQLEANGISVEVVPGVTSGLALASRLGVSLTHRDCAHSVRFVTGHARTGAIPADLDWRGMADPKTTLVLYMGGRTSPAIAQNLIDAGLDAATPVVVAAGIARPKETRWLGSLRNLAEGAGPVNNGEPVLIGIGQVFAAARATCASIRPPLANAHGIARQSHAR
jgi:uroporphyrin-III C-methyltransferase / precorrin-2 dehydrogenase / sirohydrochlorin ferrochelatase